jgi:putative addiction module component (TIGR02574 family)
MTSKSEFILNEALTMSPEERARMARCLIQSLETPPDETADAKWVELAQKRLVELEAGIVKPVSWDKIKKNVRA